MYALVDCNNFFVSCERVFRPSLEGRPVVVLSNNDGCVVSRSNESKAMGIRMCTPFYQIKHLVDSGILVACSSNYTLYGDLSSRVMSILSDSVPEIEVYSIDEAFLSLDGMDMDCIPVFCSDLAAKVKKWVGIPVSVGIAPTKTLAKIASHFAKTWKGYRGVCMMETDSKRIKALSMTPVDDVWGVGRKFSARLRDAGVRTALDFVGRPQEWVHRNFHIQGLRIWKELQGVVCIDEERQEKRKSICTSRSFADMIENEMDLVSKVTDFAALCAGKLREEKSAAEEVTVFLHTNRFRTDLPQYFPAETERLVLAANSTQEIVSAALRLLRKMYRPGYMYKKAGVIVSSLVNEDSVQIPLFDCDMGNREKNDCLSMVMDKVNGKEGCLVRLASQMDGNYADGIRSEYRSRRYSTSFYEIIEVH